ncbi:MAG TPA: hypothetical protein VK083_08425 [Nocardia sp.]|uniref:hypothetical protein n=1 Tax=Nocardia TaxID=1817 RepID=UPI002458E7F7|nr:MULTISPECIES: hypothetical protein [Nocardia]HLS76796.1 hypothetical protein [Nocardia sp.]
MSTTEVDNSSMFLAGVVRVLTVAAKFHRSQAVFGNGRAARRYGVSPGRPYDGAVAALRTAR